ncbi:TolC family protein [Lentisphaerota bacterium WC36G]|nr:TolC family protein [Lentisphaerae bacterium WC36]
MIKKLSSLTMALGFVLVGCNTENEYKKQRVDAANKFIEKIGTKRPDVKRVYTLQQCIDGAIEHNLDYKVLDLKRRVAAEQKNAAVLGMLPDLTISNDVQSRTGTPGSSSENIRTGEQSLVSSKSTQNTVDTFKAELALSTLDFGLAFLNSTQSSDKLIISKLTKRRAAQNLELDVVKTYYRVAAAQNAVEVTQDLLVRCRDIQETLKKVQDKGEVQILRLIDEQKRFLDLEIRLVSYQRSYRNACLQLTNLMGYKPTDYIKVDTSMFKKFKAAEFPNIKLLEQVALFKRPELGQLDVQKNVTRTESYKTLLMMFPTVRAFADFTYSSNKFIYTSNWFEIGAKAAYNLLRLPQQIATYRSQEIQVEEMEQRILALSLGIMAQVRIAHANIEEVKERFELNNRQYLNFNEQAIKSRKLFDKGGNLSRLTLDRLELEAAEAYVDKVISQSNYLVSCYQLLNAMGIERTNLTDIDTVIKKIKAEEAKIAKIDREIEDRLINAAKRNQEIIMTFNGIKLHDTTMPEDERKIFMRAIERSKENQ